MKAHLINFGVTVVAVAVVVIGFHYWKEHKAKKETTTPAA